MKFFEFVPLGHVCRIDAGSGFPLDYQGVSGQQYPFFKVGDMNSLGNEKYMQVCQNTISEETRKKLGAVAFPKGTIVFPKIGAAIATNKKRIITRPSCADNNVVGLIPNESKITSEFLYYLLLQTDLSKFANSGNPPSIRQTTLNEWEIPLPPLPEQQRIAAILQKADRLRRLRRYARQLSDGYLQSVFLEMFGDPVTNLKGFPKDLLGNVVRINPGIDRQIALNSKISFVPMMGVNEQTGKIIFSEERTFREVSKGYTPFIENDVLFAKITPCMENGKSAIASHLINGIGFGSTEFHVLRPTKLTTSEWIFWLIRKKEFRQLASKSFTGTAGQQRVPTSFLENFPVPIPPVALQNQFVEICKGYDQLLKRFIESERQTETLFQSLLQQAFQGEL
jgi:type I restriction enzyme S subunit